MHDTIYVSLKEQGDRCTFHIHDLLCMHDTIYVSLKEQGDMCTLHIHYILCLQINIFVYNIHYVYTYMFVNLQCMFLNLQRRKKT